jgi:hypothetical protein
MSRPFKIISLLLIVLAAGVAVYMAPCIYTASVPEYLNKNIGSFLVIDEATLTRSPPEMVLKGIHLKNPGEFGNGDAIMIQQANVVFNSFSRNPFEIKSVTLQHIRGKLIVRDKTDNLTAVHSLLMDRKYQTPHGEMAKPVVLENFIIHDNVISNEDGKIVNQIPDKALTPAVQAENPSLQSVIVDVLGTVVEQQQSNQGDIAVQNMADKATETIKEIGTSIKSFLQKN